MDSGIASLISDLHATICHALGIDLDKEVITAQG